MKILVIWNDDASGFVADLKKAFKEKYSNSLKIEVVFNEQALLNILKPKVDKNKSYKKEPFIPKRIFILVELNWAKPGNGGYTIFEEYILKYNEMFASSEDTAQITFVSVKPQKLIISELKKSGDRKSFIATHYQHIELPSSVDILKNLPLNSKFHYEFLRQVSLIEYSIIAKIEHDIDNLRGNNDDLKWTQIQQEIKCLGSILPIELIERIETFNLQYVLNNKEEIKGSIRDEYYKSVPPEKKNSNNKSEYKVVIIEDDSVQIQFLKDLLSKFFSKVEGIHINRELSLNDVLEKLKKFDIAFIDLLFEDELGFLSYSGFDIVNQVQYNNNLSHIVFRLFSNMPRHLIGSIISIPINHIIPKKLEDQTKSELIELEVNSLIDEIRTKERSKYFDFGPNIGPFDKHGLKAALKAEYQNNPSDYYRKYWSKAINFAELYISRELRLNTKDWTPKLPSSKSKNRMKLRDLMDIHLPYIFAHRLITFYYSLINHDAKNKSITVEESSFENELKTFMPSTFSFSPKAYLNTRLGIHYKISKEKKVGEFFDLEIKNLFPEEIQWLTLKETRNIKEIKIRDNNLAFYYWLYNCSQKEKFPDGNWPKLLVDWSFVDFNIFVKYILLNIKQYRNLIIMLTDTYGYISEDSLPLNTQSAILELNDIDIDCED